MNEDSEHVGYELEPATGTADSLCIMLHGYGADGSDMIDVASEMFTFLPNTHFIAPNAPEPCSTNPGFYQWYGLEGGAAGADVAVEHLAPRINRYADQQLERLDIDNSKMIMMGFSQGGGVMMEAALSRSQSCGAMLIYTGTLRNRHRLEDVVRSCPHTMIIHGEADEIVPVEHMQKAVQALEAFGIPVRYHVCPGLEHSLNEEGALVGAMFIADVLYG